MHFIVKIKKNLRAKTPRPIIFSLNVVAALVVLVLFQNCSPQFSSIPERNQRFAASTSQPEMSPVDDDTSANDELPNGASRESTSLKIDLFATSLLGIDCSSPSSSYRFDILNAGSDIMLCQEYVLDTTPGNPRYGESSKCDSNDMFSRPSSNWSYDYNQRIWSKTTGTSGSQYVPGDYRLYVKTNSGKVSSPLLKVRRYGYDNCLSTTSGSMVTSPSSGSGSSTNAVLPGGTCNPPGTKIVYMGPLNGKNSQTGQVVKNWWPRTDYYPSNNEIRVWSFTTPNVNELQISNTLGNILIGTISFSATDIPGAVYPSLIVSSCPGDTRIQQGTNDLLGMCTSNEMEAVGVNVTFSNESPQNLAKIFKENKRTNACFVKPNTTYYVSALTSGQPLYNGNAIMPATTCNQPHCGFRFTASGH